MSVSPDKIKIGLLLTNLGTPAAPTAKAVKQYLQEFLSDKRVVALPQWLWWPLLHGLVLPLRSRYSAKMYQNIWSDQGSPLLHFSQMQAAGLQRILEQQYPGQVSVALGMRYGEPNIAEALEHLRSKGAQTLIILPLYPQYSAATTGATFDKVMSHIQSWRFIPKIHWLNHYADHPGYIHALTCRIQEHWQQQPRAEKLLFSFHGLPSSSIEQGDPYFEQCHMTAQLVAARLNLDENAWMVVFQSRFGRQKWLTPYCEVTLKNLAANGVKTVDIICPGFAADCLETLEEILIRNKALFLAAGGTTLNYIPALNDHPEHLRALAEMLEPFIAKKLR